MQSMRQHRLVLEVWGCDVTNWSYFSTLGSMLHRLPSLQVCIHILVDPWEWVHHLWLMPVTHFAASFAPGFPQADSVWINPQRVDDKIKSVLRGVPLNGSAYDHP